MKRQLVLIILLFGISARAVSPKLEKLSLDPNQISVSGLSSGAMMAVQLGVVYSSWIHGVGSIAGGIFGCAEGDSQRAQAACMKSPQQIDSSVYVNKIAALAQANQIDPISNLRSSRVFIYAGTKDTVILPQASAKLFEMYKAFVSPDQIATRGNIASEHGQPTLNFGNACDKKGMPWMNNCNYDAAGETLWQIYGKLNPRGTMVTSHLKVFDQNEFGAGSASMHADGYVYIPESCMATYRAGRHGACRLHIALHGCMQNPMLVRDAYIAHAGYNEWAETNGIVILYPSATFGSGNPDACWDWWGFTGKDYLTYSGKQNQIIKSMVARLYGMH